MWRCKVWFQYKDHIFKSGRCTIKSINRYYRFYDISRYIVNFKFIYFLAWCLSILIVSASVSQIEFQNAIRNIMTYCKLGELILAKGYSRTLLPPEQIPLSLHEARKDVRTDNAPTSRRFFVILWVCCYKAIVIIPELCLPVTSNYKSKDILVANEYIRVVHLGHYLHRCSEQMKPLCNQNHIVITTCHLEYAGPIVLENLQFCQTSILSRHG